MVLSNKIYDLLKWSCVIALPALSILIQAVCSIWNLPYGNQLATTVTAIATFIGALLMISNANYKKAVDEQVEE